MIFAEDMGKDVALYNVQHCWRGFYQTLDDARFLVSRAARGNAWRSWAVVLCVWNVAAGFEVLGEGGFGSAVWVGFCGVLALVLGSVCYFYELVEESARFLAK